MNMLLILLLLLILVGALPTWPYSQSWGYWPSGLLGLFLLVMLAMTLAGGSGRPMP